MLSYHKFGLTYTIKINRLFVYEAEFSVKYSDISRPEIHFSPYFVHEKTCAEAQVICLSVFRPLRS